MGRLLRCRSCVIDGEVAIIDDEGRAIFERLQEGPRVKPEATLFALDLIEFGKNTRCKVLAKSSPHCICRFMADKQSSSNEVSQNINGLLEKRLGRLHARLRLGLEDDHEAQVFGQGINYFHFENLSASYLLINACLKLSGMYWRGRRNAAKIVVVHNHLTSVHIPEAFDGFILLHLSDLHVDLSQDAVEKLTILLENVDYDLCVLTGDYRGQAFGPFDTALAGMARVRAGLRGEVYGVLGNHDSIRMVPELEEMGIRMLLNECEPIRRGASQIYLAGIDDAHFYRADNIEKAASGIPSDTYSILLSHTPEIYRQAAHAEFKLLLCGHTHGGQICLPAGIPITLDSVLPRYMGSGAWTYHDMVGYTSVGVGSSIVPVRFNCPPEITLHHLHSTGRATE